MEIRKNLEADGYAVIPSLISPEVCALVREAFKVESIKLSQEEVVSQPSFDKYGTSYGDALLSMLQPVLSEIIEPVVPTYSYIRSYTRGSTLKLHTDRAECEVSLSIALEGTRWPFVVVDKNREVVEIEAGIGDAVVYEGETTPHGRHNPLQHDASTHIFLHYVRADGKHKDKGLDNRVILGTPYVSRTTKEDVNA